MGVIGQHIKKYRLLKGITQEQLGLLVGVTTQAVSKWECGGTPDAELLPRIAEVLEISIDALFGREDKNFALYMARKVGCMPKEESFQYVFRLLWAMGVGLLDGIENFEEGIDYIGFEVDFDYKFDKEEFEIDFVEPYLVLDNYLKEEEDYNYFVEEEFEMDIQEVEAEVEDLDMEIDLLDKD